MHIKNHTTHTASKLQSYQDWYETLTKKQKKQVDARIDRIVQQNHFGDSKDLGDGVAELRWKNGMRIYYALVIADERLVVLILGGNKNGQQKDITKAKGILTKLVSSSSET